MGFGRVLGLYIERRHYRRPLLVGLLIGALSGIFFGYYLFAAIEPGLLGAIALVFLSAVFGLVAAAVSAFIFFYLQIFRMTKMAVSETCPGCGSALPRNAAFCPYCGGQLQR